MYESGELTRIEPLEIDLDVSSDGELQTTLASSGFIHPTIRERPIEPHPCFYTSGNIPEGTKITLNLFDDTTFTTNIHSRTEHIHNITSISGDIDEFELGYTSLTFGNGNIYGRVVIPENSQRFIIKHDSNTDMHFVYEVDVCNIDEGHYAEPLVSDEEEEYEAGLLTNDFTFDPDPWEEVEIRIGVYYTEAARIEAGGTNSIEMEIFYENRLPRLQI